jgi:hypothetical protein
MRIYTSPVVIMDEKSPISQMAPACRTGNVSTSAKFPEDTHFLHTAVLLMPSRPIRFSPLLLLHHCCAVMAARSELQVIHQ